MLPVPEELPDWPDATVVEAGGVPWFICTYRQGIRRAVPPDYEDGKVIMILREFCEAYPGACPVWVHPPGPPPLLNARETASRLGVHENTIRNWVRSGRIIPVRQLNEHGWYRFTPEEAERVRRLNAK